MRRVAKFVVSLVAVSAIAGVAAVAAWLVLSVRAPSGVQPQTVAVAAPAWSNVIEKARAIFARSASAFPGISVAVSVHGQIVWSEARGYADLAGLHVATPHTQFRIYSASKAITGTLAARLVEQGKLRLDAKVRDYLPELKGAIGNAPVWTLVSHTGGVRDYYPFEWFWVSMQHCTTATQALAPFIEDELDGTPGRRYDYSSYEYVLLSAVLERAAGEPFDSLMQQNIFAPAGMIETSRLSDRPGGHCYSLKINPSGRATLSTRGASQSTTPASRNPLPFAYRQRGERCLS